MAAPRSPLLMDGGTIRFSKRSRRLPRQARVIRLLFPQQLDFFVAISLLWQQLLCVWRGLVRVLATAQGLRQRRERRSYGVSDLSRDTSSKSWKDRDLFSDSTA